MEKKSKSKDAYGFREKDDNYKGEREKNNNNNKFFLSIQEIRGITMLIIQVNTSLSLHLLYNSCIVYNGRSQKDRKRVIVLPWQLDPHNNQIAFDYGVILQYRTED